MSTVHTIAAKGFGEGTNNLYDRARPSYQPVALSHIRAAVASSTHLNVLEIGSGTGIFTRALLSHPGWTKDINQLKAAEPSSGMRQVFAQTVNDARVSVREGTFDTTGVESGWADIVIIAQAFHWCPDYDRASQEFARVLKPNGCVAFIWNLEDRDAAPWVAQLRDRIERHENGTPQFRLNLWRKAFDTSSYQAAFNPPEEKTWTYEIPATVDLTVDRACSKSYIAVLPEAEKSSVIEDTQGILERGEGKEWIDEAQGVFKYPYRTLVIISRKK
ncbi:methyltransferase type 11 [Moniliophthora roreri MCA 2997]|uniref:Methyltransferase type 11 n=2 Tax=Moniliophthora roreri TaxID=221103 RepID=V2XNY1_MONRO|nr:methyltransferase type 11 [Moniliophthora roreri MCA 2997]